MLTFFELAPSPNSTKLFMALRFKQIPFEVVPVDPADRAAVVQVSGQELTPVIRDKGIVLNDSEAILQYLDANYPETPRLFPSARAERKACDAWKERITDRYFRQSPIPVLATSEARTRTFRASQRV